MEENEIVITNFMALFYAYFSILYEFETVFRTEPSLAETLVYIKGKEKEVREKYCREDIWKSDLYLYQFSWDKNNSINIWLFFYFSHHFLLMNKKKKERRGEGESGWYESSINILKQLYIYFLFINNRWTNISCNSRREVVHSQLYLLLCPLRRAST